ncbi:hypothetical protein DOTSEDRAFT_36847 [Dothistroma septosporum NZE10]|uniref:Uncharacterized protein n=1 Tax=Dothistroma septosporum (strain NZE10 / CBS 128990) TaxID=675120 RepID=N1PFQ4_DOTSN|nr:hypothetical protein DOTSEDRAFT_36847 [Dothistroma septosporum NZE10]
MSLMVVQAAGSPVQRVGAGLLVADRYVPPNGTWNLMGALMATPLSDGVGADDELLSGIALWAADCYESAPLRGKAHGPVAAPSHFAVFVGFLLTTLAHPTLRARSLLPRATDRPQSNPVLSSRYDDERAPMKPSINPPCPLRLQRCTARADDIPPRG